MENPDAGQPQSHHRSQAVFRWGTGRFALDVGGLQEVVAGLDLTPLPRAGASWLGVGNLRGEILPAASLQTWFGAGIGQPVFLILNTSFGKLALAADHIEQVVPIDAAATEPSPEGDVPEFAPRRWQEKPDAAPIFCLDADRLAQKLREQFTISNDPE